MRTDRCPDDHDGQCDPYEYDDGCACEWCVIERGKWLARLMFGWMVHA